MAVAHGCTGKGNDQVRFDIATGALAPELRVVAPVRDWDMGRPQELEYAARHGIDVPATVESPYSVDANLWGRSIESGLLEDPWVAPRSDVFAWTADPSTIDGGGVEVTIAFASGVPMAIDGEALPPEELVSRLNTVAGAHGVGRIDHVENRLVGIKSREIYEAPAAVPLHTAHQALESMTLSRDQARFKEIVSAEYARLIYNGQWYSALHQDLAAYVQSTQRFVSGVIRMKLSHGHCAVVGRKSEHSLYSHSLATYDTGDQFDHNAALGFIKLWELPLTTQAQAQLLPSMCAEENLLQGDLVAAHIQAGRKE